MYVAFFFVVFFFSHQKLYADVQFYWKLFNENSLQYTHTQQDAKRSISSDTLLALSKT